MARKPNYPFERMERERQKAAKTAEKARLKREQKERAQPDGGGAPPENDSAQDEFMCWQSMRSSPFCSLVRFQPRLK